MWRSLKDAHQSSSMSLHRERHGGRLMWRSLKDAHQSSSMSLPVEGFHCFYQAGFDARCVIRFDRFLKQGCVIHLRSVWLLMCGAPRSEECAWVGHMDCASSLPSWQRHGSAFTNPSCSRAVHNIQCVLCMKKKHEK